MKKSTGSLERFASFEDSPSVIEYSVMIALIILVCIGACSVLGEQANETFQATGEALSSAYQ